MECYRNLDQSGSCTITCQMQKINTFCYHKYDAVDKLITKHLKCSGHVIMLLELYRSLRFMVSFSRCKVRILCTCANQSTVAQINRRRNYPRARKHCCKQDLAIVLRGANKTKESKFIVRLDQLLIFLNIIVRQNNPTRTKAHSNI